MFQLDASLIDFEHLKFIYVGGKNFGELFQECQRRPKGEFQIQQGYLFKGTGLCVPNCGIRELLIREVYRGSLPSHFDEK